LIATLFLHGAFTADDLWKTREALIAYSVGLTGLILVKVLAPGYYAQQNVRTPVQIALISLAVTQALNLAFVGFLQHAGLALSIGLAACLNATLLYRGLRRDGIFHPQPGWGVFACKIAAAIAVMAALLALASGAADAWIAYSLAERGTRLAALVLLGSASYFGTLFALGFRIRDFRRRVLD
jgi:putative peptidoglycan lipid II flippase